MRTFAVFGFVFAFGGAACACDASKAHFAVGKPFSAERAERARIAAGAATARRMVSGRAYTMEFMGARLNLHTGEDGRVSKVSCG